MSFRNGKQAWGTSSSNLTAAAFSDIACHQFASEGALRQYETMNAAKVLRDVYGGRTAEQRKAQRRDALVTAALEIWQAKNWPGVTMRGVCAAAGLTDRYFYESFTDRDDLLTTIWDQMRDETMAMLQGAIDREHATRPLDQLGVATAAIVQDIAEQPVRAQILFGDHAGSAVLQQRRKDAIQTVTQTLVDLGLPFMREGIDAHELRMSTIIGIGGFVELMQAWRLGLIEADADTITRHLTRVGAALAAAFLDAEFVSKFEHEQP